MTFTETVVIISVVIIFALMTLSCWLMDKLDSKPVNRADERAGLKNTESKPSHVVVVKNVQMSPRHKLAILAAIAAIRLFSDKFTSRNKKFRWKNYYKAKAMSLRG